MAAPGNTDRFYTWATGMDVTNATQLFQRCVVLRGDLVFEGNPDLGGIGVLISLTISCLVGTIGSISLVTLDSLSPRFQQFPRLKLLYSALTSTLGSFLDSALFLALTVQIAAAIWYLGADGGKDNISQYEGTLLMYMALIPICPVLSLINTPRFRKSIRRCDFRLFTATVVMGLAGGVVLQGTQDSLANGSRLVNAAIENKPDPFSCVSAFLMRIMPVSAEAKVLRASWVLGAIALVFAIILRLEISLEGTDAGGSVNSISSTPKPGNPTPVGPKHDTATGNENEKGATAAELPEVSRGARYWAFRVLWCLYFLVYLGLQCVPLYLLWRVRWMRGHVRQIISSDFRIYEPRIVEHRADFKRATDSWADDNWGFGQIMSLSLWLPTLSEICYLVIVGEEEGLTGRLPKPWKAKKGDEDSDIEADQLRDGIV